jgi:hypothetical protein
MVSVILWIVALPIAILLSVIVLSVKITTNQYTEFKNKAGRAKA